MARVVLALLLIGTICNANLQCRRQGFLSARAGAILGLGSSSGG